MLITLMSLRHARGLAGDGCEVRLHPDRVYDLMRDPSFPLAFGYDGARGDGAFDEAARTIEGVRLYETTEVPPGELHLRGANGSLVLKGFD